MGPAFSLSVTLRGSKQLKEVRCSTVITSSSHTAADIEVLVKEIQSYHKFPEKIPNPRQLCDGCIHWESKRTGSLEGRKVLTMYIPGH